MKPMHMLAVAALLASSQLVYGQQETDVMTANIPFTFTAGGVSMPAGHYVISRVDEAPIWKLQTPGRIIFVTSRPRALHKAPAASALVFDRNAAGYTLLQLQQQAQAEAAEIPGPRGAKERRSTVQQVAAVTVPAR